MGKKQQQDMMSSWCDNVIINEIIAVWDIWLDAVGMAVCYYICWQQNNIFLFFIKTLNSKRKIVHYRSIFDHESR